MPPNGAPASKRLKVLFQTTPACSRDASHRMRAPLSVQMPADNP